MHDVDFPPFRPHLLLRSGHAQTIVAAFMREANVPYAATRHEVELADGDRLVLHDDQPPGWRAGDAVCLLVHGLGGSHQSPYMQRIAAKLTARDWRVFRMDHRGCGAGAKLAQYPGHAGRSEDVRACLDRIASLCPLSPISLVGFSLGGNLILKMLGEDGRVSSAIDRALVVAPPMDLLPCARHMQHWSKRPYNRSFLKAMFSQLRERSERFEQLKPYVELRGIATIFDFDDRITGPLSGFRDAVDYYTQASSTPLLPNITVPTTIIAAADDPLIPVATFRSAKLSASTQMFLTDRGGHVGYLAAKGTDPDRRWIDWRVLEWLGERAVLDRATVQR